MSAKRIIAQFRQKASPKAEILNLFSTFITTQKSFPQLKPKKAEYPFTEHL